MNRFSTAPRPSRPHAGLPVLSVLAIALGCAGPAWAIDGGNIAAGTGTLQTQRNVTTVNQSSDRMVVNWQNFDIARNQTVNFQQPGASAAVLNRVSGSGKASEILGSINANGRVFVVNPDGVTFGRTARVDVGALVASALDTGNEQFMKLDGDVGNYGGGYLHFAGTTAGSVQNQGRINATGSVALIGPQVVNRGTIQARQVQLHAADVVAMNGQSLEATPTTPSSNAFASNEGTIRAPGGDVVMSAAAIGNQIRDVVRNTGTIEATYAATYEGGGIRLLAPVDGLIDLGGRVSASRLVEATTQAAADFDGPMQAMSRYDRAATGRDVRVAKNALLTGEGMKQLSAYDGDLSVQGRVNGAIVDLRGDQVGLHGAVNATYDVNVKARKDVSQSANVTTTKGHINMEGANIYQGERTNTRAGNYISLSTPDQGGVYQKDGVVEVVPSNTYRSGRLRTGNLEADSVALVSHDIEMNGRVKSRGDVQVIAMSEKFICQAGAGEGCIALATTPGRVRQHGDVVSTEGSIRYSGGYLDQDATTRTRAADTVFINASDVTAANIEAGKWVGINANSVTLKGRVVAPQVDLPANVRYEGGSVRRK